MKTTIRLLSGMIAGAILAGCSADAYVSKRTEKSLPMSMSPSF